MVASRAGRQGSLADVGLRTGLRWLSPAGRRAGLSIVLFHRVLSARDALFPDDMDSAHFDRICSWLAAWFNVLPLDRALELQGVGRLPDRALAITFDDGYADNHDVALPILRAHGLCATFFIATAYLDGGRMWNDTIVEAVRRSCHGALDLTGLGLPLPDAAPLDSLVARRDLALGLLRATKYLAAEQRQAVADEIAQRSGAVLPDDLMMTAEELRRIAASGMQVGAHTLSHPILARLQDREAEREIRDGKASLEALLGQRVDLFAYPNGKPGRDYLPRDVDLVRRAGFTAAVSTAYGVACGYPAHRFELPRFTPWDRDRVRFGLRLARNYFVRPATA